MSFLFIDQGDYLGTDVYVAESVPTFYFILFVCFLKVFLFFALFFKKVDLYEVTKIVIFVALLSVCLLPY